MFRPDRRTAVLPLTAAILLGTAGSALAIPNTDPNNPPPPPPNQAPTAALNVTPNPGLVAPQLQVTAISAKVPGRRPGQRPEPQRGQLRRLRLQRPRRDDRQVQVGPRRQRHVREDHQHDQDQPKLHRPGDVAVEVRVIDNGNKTDTATKTLTVHAPPVAKIAAAPQDITVGQTVTFSAAGSSDPDGDRQVQVGPRRQRHVRDEHRHEPDRRRRRSRPSARRPSASR